MAEYEMPGIETYFWKGQKRWCCPKKWESGDKCGYSTHDQEQLVAHMSGPHTRSGKPALPTTPRVSAVLDSEGNPFVYPTEPELPEEYKDYGFKRSE